MIKGILTPVIHVVLSETERLQLAAFQVRDYETIPGRQRGGGNTSHRARNSSCGRKAGARVQGTQNGQGAGTVGQGGLAC